MVQRKNQKRLKKELKFKDVYAVATGATLSAGFFLLPGIAAQQAGSGLILAYLIAAIPMIPAMFSVIELATAMPRAGGVYYFLDRSLGPYIGTIGGIGTWLALILKVSFALVGMGAYLSLFFSDMPITPMAIIIALLLGGINLIGAKKGSKLQIYLVIGLMTILAIFFGAGILNFHTANLHNFFVSGFDSILGTAGMVYISYVGITKVASLSEEVEDPERNLPKGVICALTSAILVYFVGTLLIVALVPMAELRGNLTPVASAAHYAMGPSGVILVTVAALLAFVSVANAGLMSASRYPLAMSRDHLLPSQFRKLGKSGMPQQSIYLTVTTIILILVIFDPMRIAKLASAFQLLMFALVCVAVIVMRESHIPSYDPGYKSPLYPWMQIAGIILPLFLIFEMGILSILFSVGLIVAASLWYYFYGRKYTARTGALYHVFARLGQQKHSDLDSELRGILREKGLRKEDPFADLVSKSLIFDLENETTFEALLELVAPELGRLVEIPPLEVINKIMEGTRIGATPVTHGIALPHFRTDTIEIAQMVLVRARHGVHMTTFNSLTHEEEGEKLIAALFFLVSPEANPTQHLRILARIAERVEEESFIAEWNSAITSEQLKQCLLNDDRFLTLTITPETNLAHKSLQELPIPSGCVVAMLHRSGNSFVPNLSTILENGDHLTIIGQPEGLKELKNRYLVFQTNNSTKPNSIDN